ncbi:hypothetical protein Hdeb2414_s0003g00110101 [Helianthus debilis subsp. tardiflorus]
MQCNLQQEEEEEEMAGKVMAMADGNALTPEADCQPLTHERKVRTDLETHLPKPCMFFGDCLSFFLSRYCQQIVILCMRSCFVFVFCFMHLIVDL